MTFPTTIVCAGGGGVGKTTSSAALGLALARAGARTLVVTVDPARRLASAMGVQVGPMVQQAHVEPGLEGRLFALMPEPRQSTRTFVDLLFHDEPEALQRMLDNRVYRLLADAAAGMHEVVSLMLVARAIEETAFDYLVIDTAPSRQGLDFISYPGRLATLYEGRAVTWLSNLAKKNDSDGEVRSASGGLLAAGRRRVEALFGRLVNPQTLRDLAGMFAELAIVKERFAHLARVSEALLTGNSTRYLLVAAPSGSAAADVRFLARKLKRFGQRPRGVILNRSDAVVPRWLMSLQQTAMPKELQEALQVVGTEYEARVRAGDALTRSMAGHLPHVEAVRMPTLELRDPTRIVGTLATQFGAHLSMLTGWTATPAG